MIEELERQNVKMRETLRRIACSGEDSARTIARIALAEVTRPGNNRQRQLCKVCGYPDKLGFHVPDEIWAAIVPAQYLNRVVCLFCFDEFARERNVAYADALSEVWFVGDKAVLRLAVASAITN